MSAMTPEQFDDYKRQHETPIDDVIGEERITLHAGSAAYPILLQIGRPFLDEHGVGVCPVASWGLNDRADIMGHTPFQALCLGIRFLETTLRAEVDRLDARVELDGEGKREDDGSIDADVEPELPNWCKPRPEDLTSHGIISTLFGSKQSRTAADPGSTG